MRLLVTGASSGIGRALVEQMADQVSITMMARRADLLAELEARTGASAVSGDVSNYEDCVRFVAAAPGDGELALVNCAGNASFGSFHQASWESIVNQVEVNLLGMMAACHAAIPEMLKAGSGQIINVLSITSTMVFPGSAGYSSAKAGGLMFTKILNAEYRRQGIRCTALLPGAVDTPIWDGQAHPPREEMLSANAVAGAIKDLLLMPKDRAVDELVLMPPRGVL